METEELPQFDPNVDYNVILPIRQKRMLAFINNFIMNTVSFMNTFAQTCESRLLEFEYKIQKVEAGLLILESQLASIPDLVENVTENKVIEEVPKEKIVEEVLDLPEIADEERGTIASKDERFSKFFKMLQFGVPAQAVKNKMQSEGLDPNILDNPNAIIPV